jgi:DNA modification methylase
MKIQNVAVKDLIPYPLNNKKHSNAQIGSIIESIKEFGFVQPIVADRDLVVVIGHARLEAAKKIGLQDVPVLILEDATDHQTKRLRLLDNRLSDLGEYDIENIKSELDALGDDDLFELFKGMTDTGEDGPDDGDTSVKDSLLARFGIPPFSIFDTRQGYWIERRDHWKKLIVNDGESREETLFKASDTEVGKRITDVGTVSIFDPVLAEILVKWFCPENGKVFDTFAGGASGFVYAYLGHPFTGIELRKQQADINNARLETHGLHGEAKYICDDGQNILRHVEEKSQDFFFSCPPYFDLEVYSDDPKDASNQKEYSGFLSILENALTDGAKALKDNRFAAIVMSNVRDSRGFYVDIVGDIKRIMRQNGLHLYNDIILVNSAGSAPLRANNAMRNRKVVRTHQNVMVFYKGDTAESISEKHGFDVLHSRQTIQFHEDVLVFFKGDPKRIQEEFPAIDLADAAGMDEAIAEAASES